MEELPPEDGKILLRLRTEIGKRAGLDPTLKGRDCGQQPIQSFWNEWFITLFNQPPFRLC